MKKKILSFFMSLCLVLPFAVILTACEPAHEHEAMSAWEHNATHHWHKCKDETCDEELDKATHTLNTVTITPATIDSDGSEKQVCDCGYETTPTVIPKLVQSTDDMVAVLHDVAHKDDSYTYIKTESSNNMAGVMMPGYDMVQTTVQHMAKNADTVVTYTTSPIEEAPPTWEAEDYFSDVVYYLKDTSATDSLYVLSTNNDGTNIEAKNKFSIGNNYIANSIESTLDEAFAFARVCETEAQIEAAMKEFMVGVIDIYAETMSTYGHVNKDDIDVDVTASYNNQKYSITITVSTDNVTYKANTSNKFKINSFEMVYTGEYTKDTIVKLQGSMDMDVTLGTNTPETEDDLPYTIQSDTIITPSTNASDATPHIEKIAAYLEDNSLMEVSVRESVSIYVDNMLMVSDRVPTNTKINSTVDDYLAELNSTFEGKATFAAYLDSEHTIPYVASNDLIVEDYYGASVYIKLTLVDTTKAVIFTTYKLNYFGMSTESQGRILAIGNSGEYTIQTTYKSTTYADFMYVDHVPTTETTITVEGGQVYYIDCETMYSGG